MITRRLRLVPVVALAASLALPSGRALPLGRALPPGRALPLGLALLLGLAFPLDVEARMYQWVNPGTGVTQMSGKPPPWYRSSRAGPRVVVFNNGSLVDDTAIELTAEQSLALREEAFSEAEESSREAAVRQLEKAAARDAVRRSRQRSSSEVAEVAAAPATEVAQTPAPAPVAEEASEGPLDPAFVGQLKALIEAFDRQSGAGTSQ